MTRLRQKLSNRRRRAFVAAPVIAVLALAAAFLLWPAEPRTAPQRVIVPAERTAPLPLAYEPPPEPEPEKPKREPKPEPKKEPPKEVRIDRRAAAPVSVAVPSVGIAAPTIALGLTEERKLEVPEDISDAGWREAGPEPGERGAAVITAHVNGGGSPGAFHSLDGAAAGSEIDVRRKDGSTVTFVAQRTERVAKDDFPTERVYGETRLPTLRLITCGGAFDESSGHYRDNLIVYATRKAS